jgi:hypothetical protein
MKSKSKVGENSQPAAGAFATGARGWGAGIVSGSCKTVAIFANLRWALDTSIGMCNSSSEMRDVQPNRRREMPRLGRAEHAKFATVIRVE